MWKDREEVIDLRKDGSTNDEERETIFIFT
jgi:hypothetical protein